MRINKLVIIIFICIAVIIFGNYFFYRGIFKKQSLQKITDRPENIESDLFNKSVTLNGKVFFVTQYDLRANDLLLLTIFDGQNKPFVKPINDYSFINYTPQSRNYDSLIGKRPTSNFPEHGGQVSKMLGYDYDLAVNKSGDNLGVAWFEYERTSSEMRPRTNATGTFVVFSGLEKLLYRTIDQNGGYGKVQTINQYQSLPDAKAYLNDINLAYDNQGNPYFLYVLNKNENENCLTLSYVKQGLSKTQSIRCYNTKDYKDPATLNGNLDLGLSIVNDKVMIFWHERLQSDQHENKNPSRIKYVIWDGNKINEKILDNEDDFDHMQILVNNGQAIIVSHADSYSRIRIVDDKGSILSDKKIPAPKYSRRYVEAVIKQDKLYFLQDNYRLSLSGDLYTSQNLIEFDLKKFNYKRKLLFNEGQKCDGLGVINNDLYLTCNDQVREWVDKFSSDYFYKLLETKGQETSEEQLNQINKNVIAEWNTYRSPVVPNFQFKYPLNLYFDQDSRSIKYSDSELLADFNLKADRNSELSVLADFDFSNTTAEQVLAGSFVTNNNDSYTITDQVKSLQKITTTSGLTAYRVYIEVKWTGGITGANLKGPIYIVDINQPTNGKYRTLIIKPFLYKRIDDTDQLADTIASMVNSIKFIP